MTELIEQITSNYQASLLIVFNLIILEAILSVDNAAVLATMVLKLPKEQRPRALNYGIAGAYIFRIIFLFFAFILYKILWLKAIGAIYLLWLFAKHFKKILGYGQQGYIIFQIVSIILFLLIDPFKNMSAIIVKSLLGLYTVILLIEFVRNIQRSRDICEPGEECEKPESNNLVYNFFVNKFGTFWATVIAIEVMDVAFSLDNIFAAVAFTDNIILICFGVFIGILALRFAAEIFVKLLDKFPFLEYLAFLVIGILGAKLFLSYTCSIQDSLPVNIHQVCKITESHGFDLGISGLTVAVFVLPVVFAIIKDKISKSK